MDWLDDGPISGEDLMAEIVAFYPETLDYLAGIGMHCLSCSSSQLETLSEACHAHNLRPGPVVAELNRIVME